MGTKKSNICFSDTNKDAIKAYEILSKQPQKSKFVIDAINAYCPDEEKVTKEVLRDVIADVLKSLDFSVANKVEVSDIPDDDLDFFLITD